jgi:hypothetical protein
MAETIVGIKLNASVSGAEQVKKLKEEIKAAEAEAKKIAKEFGESSKEAQKAAEKVTKLAQGLDSFKSIKTQIREATQEAVRLAQQFGEFSPEAVAAAKRVAELKDQMGDFQQRVAGLNPDKFEAVATVAQGLAGGISAVTGAMALFGAESEDVQKTMMQVQGAMAFAQGIQQLLNMQNALGAVATMIRTNVVTAFTTLKGAMAATGIGLLIVAITSAIQYLNDLGSEAEKAAERSKEALDFIDRVSQKDVKSMELAIEKRKLAGASEKVLHETRIRFMKMRVRDLEDELKKDVGNLEVQEKLTEARQAIELENLKFQNKVRDEDTKKRQEQNAKNEELRKADEQKRKEQREKEAADALERRATLLALEQDTLAQQIAAADAAFATRIKGYKEKNFTEIEINKLRDAELEKVRTEFYAKQQAEQEKAAADEKARKEKEAADAIKATDDYYKKQQVALVGNNEALAQLEVERLQSQINNAKQFGQSTVDLELQLAQKKKEIYDADKKAKEDSEKAKQEAQMATLNEAVNAVGALGGILKEGSDAAKAAALLDIAIKTGVGFAQGLDIAQKGAAATGPAAPYAFPIFYAQQVAAVLGAMSRAKAILKGGSGGSGGGGGMGAVGAAPSPMTPLTGGALPEEGQFGGMGRVYVLEGDITKTQTRVRRLRNTSVV